jgi:hypothetical protein
LVAWIFVASLAVTFVAFGTSLALLRRSGDLRVALLSGLFVALAVGQSILAISQGGEPHNWGANLAIACAGLVASVFGWLAVRAMGRTLADLDHSESLHWSSMEGVRALSELSAERSYSTEERVARLLEIGSRCFGLEIAIVSRVKGTRYEVSALRAPPDFPIVTGAVLPLSETCCWRTCESMRPVAHSSVAETRGGEIRGALPFEAYLGVALREGGELLGTLAFGSLRPRGERFTASEKDLIGLMARWLELEREERAGAPVATSQTEVEPVSLATNLGAEHAPPRAPWVGVRPARRRVVDINAVARRGMEKVRRELADGVGLHLDLEDDLPPAIDLRLPLEAIVMSLVRHAAAGLRGGGEIFIETRLLESESAVPELVPSHAPSHYVTLSVHDTGEGSDETSLAAWFDETPDTDESARANHPGPLRLSTVYRMLQRCGGDLSVEVEPGHGTSLTIFLPRAERTSDHRPTHTPLVAVGPAA